jgi:hypothetical protein
MEYYLVGTIVATHGIKGELKVKIETSFPEKRFKKGNKLYLKNNQSYQEIIISSYRMHKQMALITINHLLRLKQNMLAKVMAILRKIWRKLWLVKLVKYKKTSTELLTLKNLKTFSTKVKNELT